MKNLTASHALAVSLFAASPVAFAQDSQPAQAPTTTNIVKDTCQNGTAYAEIQINEYNRGSLTLNDQRIDPAKSPYKRLFHLTGTFNPENAYEAFKQYCDNQTVPRANNLLQDDVPPNEYLHASLRENGDIKRSARLRNRGKTSMASFYEGATRIMKINQTTIIPTNVIYDYAQTGIKPETPEND